MKPYEDPCHPSNGVEHNTGKKCIEHGCDKPAGTAWSPYWCQEHNAKRMNEITRSLHEFQEQLNYLMR